MISSESATELLRRNKRRDYVNVLCLRWGLYHDGYQKKNLNRFPVTIDCPCHTYQTLWRFNYSDTDSLPTDLYIIPRKTYSFIFKLRSKTNLFITAGNVENQFFHGSFSLCLNTFFLKWRHALLLTDYIWSSRIKFWLLTCCSSIGVWFYGTSCTIKTKPLSTNSWYSARMANFFVRIKYKFEHLILSCQHNIM